MDTLLQDYLVGTSRSDSLTIIVNIFLCNYAVNKAVPGGTLVKLLIFLVFSVVFFV